MSDLKEATQNLKDDAKKAATTVKEDVQEVARQTSHHVRELADSAEHSLLDTGKAITEKIRNKPIQSSIIALGLGLTIGFLCRR